MKNCMGENMFNDETKEKQQAGVDFSAAGEDSFSNLYELPLNRIKRIMQNNSEEVHISNEGLFAMSKAAVSAYYYLKFNL